MEFALTAIMTARTAFLAAIPAAALVLAACGGTTTPPGPATSSHPASQTAALSCKRLYEAWRIGPAKSLGVKVVSEIGKVQSAAAVEDVPALNSALHATGRIARQMTAYPIPACADPKGYYGRFLDLLRAAGDNAGTSSGLGGLMLAMAPLEKIPAVEKHLTAELKKTTAK